MSGHTYHIEDLFLYMRFQDLVYRVRACLAGSHETISFDLILDDEVLKASKHGNKTLSELDIRGGAVLTLVRTACVAFFELKGAQGDGNFHGSPEESFARVCLLDDENCILVRRSHSKIYAGMTLRSQFVW